MENYCSLQSLNKLNFDFKKHPNLNLPPPWYLHCIYVLTLKHCSSLLSVSKLTVSVCFDRPCTYTTSLHAIWHLQFITSCVTRWLLVFVINVNNYVITVITIICLSVISCILMRLFIFSASNELYRLHGCVRQRFYTFKNLLTDLFNYFLSIFQMSVQLVPVCHVISCATQRLPLHWSRHH